MRKDKEKMGEKRYNRRKRKRFIKGRRIDFSGSVTEP
jgi:hypothetical protein